MITVYLDLDGVLFNFNKMCAKFADIEYPSNHAFTQEGFWIHQFMSEDDFHKMVMSKEEFWADLEPFPWADKMIDIADEVTEGNWYFLTTQSPVPECFSGKAKSIHKHFADRDGLRKLIICKHKELLCHGGHDFLIDDLDKNINNWKKAGGSYFQWQEVTDDFDPKKISDRLASLKVYLTSIKNIYV